MGIKTDIAYRITSDRDLREYSIFISAVIKSMLHPRTVCIPFKVGLVAKENEYIRCNRFTENDLQNILCAKTFGFNFLITSFSRDMIDLCMAPWENALEQKIHTIPFGFDPLIYYPVNTPEQIDFFFVGTNSMYKTKDTQKYLWPIVDSYNGILRGAHWGGTTQELPPEASRDYYSSARINPNYHLDIQRDLPCEVNERTFVISACGGFQLVDNPKIISQYYSEDQVAISDTPEEYLEQFKNYLVMPELRNQMAYSAMRRSYRDQYDLFHRIEPIIEEYIKRSR